MLNGASTAVGFWGGFAQQHVLHAAEPLAAAELDLGADDVRRANDIVIRLGGRHDAVSSQVNGFG